MKRFLIIPAVIAGLLSCGNPYEIQTLQEQSVTQIPCPPDRIEIIEHVIHQDGSASWTALCQGRTYSCRRAAGEASNPEVSCSEMESQMPE
ncbi:MAG: hypothetical protein RIG61_08275 [Deltaproteobacteria bacterium]